MRVGRGHALPKTFSAGLEHLPHQIKKTAKHLSDGRPLACFTSVLEDPFNLRRNG